MGIEKQGTKGGNYVGGFLQMFDWNAKSRKKLFSSKSDIPEQSKQKKRCDGNLPTTRLQMLDEDESAAGSSVKGSSDYSCASSVIDEDFCGTKAPGVVARLMGLDSLPKSNMREAYSTPLFDSQSLRDSYYRTKGLEYCQDQIMHSGSLQDVSVRNDTEPKYTNVKHRPIEKFQTEMLPPKSAKSIPITHHKLLSPIKSGSFIPSKDAAHIMEAAARIIEPGHQTSTKTKLPHVGSSVPLRVRDLKEKVQASGKQSKLFEGSQRKTESRAIKNLSGQSMNRSWNGSADAASVRVTQDSEESSVGVKSKGKSISLALQAKANVQKREGLNVNGGSSRGLVSQKEPSEHSPGQLFKCQSTTQKSMLNKQSTQNASSVLRQNNQKQNCIVDRGKLPSKCNSKGAKTLNGEPSSARQRSSSKLAGTPKVSSRKLGSEVKDEKRGALSSSSERVTRKKRSIDGNYHSEKSQAAHNTGVDENGKAIQSSTIMDRQSSWDQDSGRTGTDVISFTFTAPMTRSGSGSGRSTEPGENYKIFSSGSQSKRALLSLDGSSASKFSFVGHNIKGGDALSTLLEQKLKELAHKVEFSQQKLGMISHDSLPGHKAIVSSTIQEANKTHDGMQTDNQVVLEDMSTSDSSISQARKLLDCRLPSPVSVLEHSTFVESWNSSDSADSNSTGGGKQCSSVQAQEVLDTYSLKMFLPIEGDAELSDSASSTSIGTVAKRQGTTLTLTDNGKPKRWELHECLELRCRKYVSGGCKLWAKGLTTVRRKERLAEEVYKEVSGWSGIGDAMIDELVDKDMSSQHGRWLDFDTEAFELGIQMESRILNSLIDEVVADMLVL
ncbi:hypothetical protein Salat_0551100 [Sesamum alatum]|uniref:DUF4378 domain-containing protein n=1 Tax=Sesamum alatum TaxID=300844 RepID=A0AAE1YPK2_9LAMI|nr:hypothetical protein Salat_0551100 [Sesamum alatum]